MNNKIDTNEVLATVVGISIAFFPGISASFMLNTSNNASLISIILAFIIGFIPVLFISKISKDTNKSLSDYINKKYKIGPFINFILILIAIFILFISAWLIIDFIISQFLTRTSYYFIGILLFLVSAFTINKEIEVLSRTNFILFVSALISLFVLWITLFPYSKFDNIKPFLDTDYKNILRTIFIYISTTTFPMIYILDLKHITKDKKNFSKKLILGYCITSFIIIVFIYLLLSIYTIDLASIFTYPIHSLFKKTEVFGFIERIENFAAILIIVASFIQNTYLLYYLRNNIKKIIKNKKKISLITYLLSLIIPIISITLFKNHNPVNIVKMFPYILSLIMIIIIMLFIKTHQH